MLVEPFSRTPGMRGQERSEPGDTGCRRVRIRDLSPQCLDSAARLVVAPPILLQHLPILVLPHLLAALLDK
jgi:hypothetical protein